MPKSGQHNGPTALARTRISSLLQKLLNWFTLNNLTAAELRRIPTQLMQQPPCGCLDAGFGSDEGNEENRSLHFHKEIAVEMLRFYTWNTRCAGEQRWRAHQTPRFKMEASHYWGCGLGSPMTRSMLSPSCCSYHRRATEMSRKRGNINVVEPTILQSTQAELYPDRAPTKPQIEANRVDK